MGEIATADMSMFCNISAVLSLQLMKGSFVQFLVLKNNVRFIIFFTVHGNDSLWIMTFEQTRSCFIHLFEKQDVLCYRVWRLSIRLLTFSFPANSSYSLHLIKLKLAIQLDHDVEQHILFWGYSPPNSSRVMPLWKILDSFCFRSTPTLYIQSS